MSKLFISSTLICIGLIFLGCSEGKGGGSASVSSSTGPVAKFGPPSENELLALDHAYTNNGWRVLWTTNLAVAVSPAGKTNLIFHNYERRTKMMGGEFFEEGKFRILSICGWLLSYQEFNYQESGGAHGNVSRLWTSIDFRDGKEKEFFSVILDYYGEADLEMAFTATNSDGQHPANLKKKFALGRRVNQQGKDELLVWVDLEGSSQKFRITGKAAPMRFPAKLIPELDAQFKASVDGGYLATELAPDLESEGP